jgi:hypothetical protein
MEVIAPIPFRFHHCAYFSCFAPIFSTTKIKLDIIFQSQSKALHFSFVCHIISLPAIILNLNQILNLASNKNIG